MDFDRFKSINDEMRNVGVMESPSTVRSFKNEACGDAYVIYLRIEEGVIVDASFTTTGCGFGLAALALATEWIKGKTLEQAEALQAVMTSFSVIPASRSEISASGIYPWCLNQLNGACPYLTVPI